MKSPAPNDRDSYPHADAMRDRLLHLIQVHANGSREAFCALAGMSPATLRSYIEGTRAPSAAVLFRLWEATGISPTYLLTGVGPESQPPPRAELAQWRPSVFSTARTTLYATNAELAYDVEPTNSRLVVHGEFSQPQRKPVRGLDLALEAGLMAIFRNDVDQGGVDWSAAAGLNVRAGELSAGATLILKIKTGVVGKRITEVAFALEGPPPRFLRAKFADARALHDAFDPRYVRVVTLAVRPAAPAVGRFRFTIDDVSFLEPLRARE